MQCLSLRSGAIAVCHAICFAAYFRSGSSCVFLPGSFIIEIARFALRYTTRLSQPGVFGSTIAWLLKHHASRERFTLLSFSIQSTDKKPPAANVCARLRCHRLRYGFLLTQAHPYFMPRKNPTLCDLGYISFTGRASRWHSLLHSLRSFRFKASRLSDRKKLQSLFAHPQLKALLHPSL
jgi:hypothetical protein